MPTFSPYCVPMLPQDPARAHPQVVGRQVSDHGLVLGHMPPPRLQRHLLVIQRTLVRLLQPQVGVLACRRLPLDLHMCT